MGNSDSQEGKNKNKGKHNLFTWNQNIIYCYCNFIIIIGGFITSVGYLYSYTCNEYVGCDIYNAYSVGYTVVLFGLCIVNALDMGLYHNIKMYKATK